MSRMMFFTPLLHLFSLIEALFVRLPPCFHLPVAFRRFRACHRFSLRHCRHAAADIHFFAFDVSSRAMLYYSPVAYAFAYAC